MTWTGGPAAYPSTLLMTVGPAQAAGVKTLVLSHLVPAEDPQVTEQMWIDAARVHFRGPVIVGRDLLEI